MKIKLFFVSLALLVTSQSTFADTPGMGRVPIPQIPPSQIQPNELPKFKVEKTTPKLPSPTIDSQKISVKTLKITGQTLFDEQILISVAEFKSGSDLALSDLRLMTAKIANYFHINGFFLAQVYLPTQTIKDGVITIVVMVGEYGSVNFNNQSTLSSSLVTSLMKGIESGNVIEFGPLETRLLLLSDLPGVQVSSTLVPGAVSGTTDLNIELTAGAFVTSSIEADNAGLPATGANRLGAIINLNNLTGLGDLASLRILSSGVGMTYGRASYQIQVERATVGAAYTQIDYSLGKQYTDLGVHGIARITSVYSSYPLIRSRNLNLYAQLGFDYRVYEDEINLINSATNIHNNVLMPGLYGDHRDSFGGRGLTTYSLTWSLGNLDIKTVAARNLDIQTANTHGPYQKLAFQTMRLQDVMETPFSLYGAVNGQVASKNLNIWEKMSLGGMYGVRSYPAGAAFGDQGYIVNLEARYLLPKWSNSIPGSIHLILLYDTGYLNYNKNVWAPANNSVTLNGAGVGVTWSDPNNFSFKGYYAHTVGQIPSTITSSASEQFWLQLIKYF